MPRCSHCKGTGWVAPGETEDEMESRLLRTPAPTYVAGPNDHVWSDGACVKCNCARLGTRAILSCPVATPTPIE